MNQTEITLVIIAVVVLAIGIRVWRATREQRVKIGTIWVAPALFAVVTVWALLVDGFTTPLDIVLAVVALVLGGTIGLYQGTHTTVRVDQAARVMYVKAKPIGAAIFVVVIAVRLLIRTSSVLPAIQNSSLAAGSVPLPPKGDLVSIISTLLLALALGVILGNRVFLLRKYQSEAPTNG